MLFDPVSELYIPYLSDWLRNRLSAATLPAGSAFSFDATILYADLSGFTELTAAFALLPDGAERLHEVLTLFYSTMVSTVATYDGDVVSIAGDAFTAWWPERIDSERGQRCGMAMLAALATLPEIATPNGSFRLDMRIGIAAGPIEVVLAGLPAHGVHFTLAGPAMQAAVAAERAVAHGQIQLAPAVVSITEKGETSPMPAPAAGDSADLAGQYMRLTTEHFLPPTFAERLRIGALVAEYRRCVPAFAAFDLPHDPVALHNLVARVQTIVSRWGGWLNEVEIGDKGAVFVLLFGAPVAHGEDPVRAVGCCLELRALHLISHAGITLGTLFVGAVGSPARRVYTAQGDEMNVAAHLMHIATPGEILVSGRVQNEIARRYQTSEPVLLQVKGHDRPLPVARVALASNRYGRMGGASLHRYPPATLSLIGRTAEWHMLEQAVIATLIDGPQVVIVEGESGIGKSYFVQALMARWLELGYEGYSGESSSGQITPFFLWQPILADICAIDEAASLSLQLEQIEQAMVARRGDTPITISPHVAESEASWNQSFYSVTRWLAHLLRLGNVEAPGVEYVAGSAIKTGLASGIDPYEAMLEAALTLLIQRLIQGPLLIVLENVHWADDLSLRLADQLIQRTMGKPLPYPLLLVLSHRPLDEPLPAALTELRNHSRSTRIGLGSLSVVESQQLLCLLLDAQEVPSFVNEFFERHAHGQPLFIKEYVRALCERNIIQVVDGRVQLHGDPEGVEPSDTVQGIIQARVDRLDEATRLTLKVAAAIGRTFPLSLLLSIHPAQPPLSLLMAQIQQLITLKIVELELDEPERVYRFKHGITHEVAYASLLFGQRRALHTAIARWYESAYAEDITNNRATTAVYRLLVYHYRRAEDVANQARYCRIIAEQAARQYANTTALEYLATALALTTDPGERFDLLLLRVAINHRLGEQTIQSDDLGALAALAEQLHDDLRRAHAGYWRLLALLTQGAYRLVIAEAVQYRLLATQATHQERSVTERRRALLVRAACLKVQGRAAAELHDLKTARLLYEQALVLCAQVMEESDEQQRDPAVVPKQPSSRRRTRPLAPLPSALDPQTLATRCLDHLGAIYFALGRFEQSLRCHQQALSATRAAGDWISEARSLTQLSRIYHAQHDYDIAYQHAERALTISHATGDRVGQVMALRQSAAIHAARHNFAEAQRYAMRALMICSHIGATGLEAQILNDLAEFALLPNDPEWVKTLHAATEATQPDPLQQ